MSCSDFSSFACCLTTYNLPLQSDTLTQALHPTTTQHRSEILRACTQNGPEGETHTQCQLSLTHTNIHFIPYHITTSPENNKKLLYIVQHCLVQQNDF